MRKVFSVFTLFAFCALCAMPMAAHAHSPIFDCFDNGDGTVSCQGGFSDGSSASGVKIVVKEGDKVTHNAQLDSNSEVSFPKPSGAYSVTFDGGEGHSITVDGKNIVE